MCECDTEPADVYVVKQRRAAKEHECIECGYAIVRGETYELASCLYDGQWAQWKTCLYCAAAWRAFVEFKRKHLPDDGCLISGGALMSCLHEHQYEMVGEPEEWPEQGEDFEPKLLAYERFRKERDEAYRASTRSTFMRSKYPE